VTTVSPQYEGWKRGGTAGTAEGARALGQRLPPLFLDVVLAVAGVAVSALTRLVLVPVLEYNQPFITAYVAVLLLGLFRGVRCAIFFMALAIVVHGYLFVPHYNSLRFESAIEFLTVIAFAIAASMITIVAWAHAQRGQRLAAEAAERRRAEEEVRALNRELEQRVRERTRQLEEANRELESFSYSVSHDLRAPLRHIAGFTDMMEKRIGPALDETSKRYMAVVMDAVARAGSLVDDLLAFSRMARADLMETQVDIAILVQEIVREFEDETGQRQITWKISPELPTVHADPSMLRQVWRNLISNAVKYSRQSAQPAIEIGANPDHPGVDGHEDVVFYVRDNGVGFDMKYADKLFGVFQRLHRSDEFEGTGIGLANVRRIIQRHGGRAWAKAAPGQGATFYFSLPAHRERTRA
jgi:signal transduction histidine kinase